MHLQFVGCGDAFGSGGRFNTCFHLVGSGINALIDCGASSLVALNKLAIDRNDIDIIFISHFHADHFGGLPFFVLEANYVRKRERPLTIAGPPGLNTRFPKLVELAFPGANELQLRFPLTLRELEIGRRGAGRRHQGNALSRRPRRPRRTLSRLPLRSRRQDHRLFRRHRMDRCSDRDWTSRPICSSARPTCATNRSRRTWHCRRSNASSARSGRSG